MRKTMDGDETAFAVPGEPHENLPAGGFAGRRRRAMGSASRTVARSVLSPERATGGDGQFGYPAAEFGNTIVGMGDIWTDMFRPALTAGASAVVGTALQTAANDPNIQAQLTAAAQEPLQKKVGEFVIQHWIPIVGGAVASVFLIIYLLGRRKGKS